MNSRTVHTSRVLSAAKASGVTVEKQTHIREEWRNTNLKVEYACMYVCMYEMMKSSTDRARVKETDYAYECSGCSSYLCHCGSNRANESDRVGKGVGGEWERPWFI